MNIEANKRLKSYFQMCSGQVEFTFENLKKEIQKYENEEFIIDGDIIYVKDMKNIYFEVVIENNVIGIRKEVIE